MKANTSAILQHLAVSCTYLLALPLALTSPSCRPETEKASYVLGKNTRQFFRRKHDHRFTQNDRLVTSRDLHTV